MKTLKRIKFSLFVLILLVLTGCGEYVPNTVIYKETPTTYVYYTHHYPRYYYHNRYRPYYRTHIIRETKIEHHRHDSSPRVRYADNRNKRPSKPTKR